MGKLVETVINISEGRDREKIRMIGEAADKIREVWLLSASSDVDHNRSVLTLFGSPGAVFEAACNVFEQAIAVIDLSSHLGIHPRIGAVDVVPFVPLWGVKMAECIEMARAFGAFTADRFSVPAYLYGQAATSSQRRDLAAIRKGQFEGLSRAVREDPGRRPDFGAAALHPTAGAVAVGARNILIAFNVILKSTDLSLAREIAGQVREQGGGLRSVKALGLYLESRGRVQVSMNLADFRQTSVWKAFEAVRRKASRCGIEVESSEIIGHAPRSSLSGTSLEELRLRGTLPNLFLEDAVFNATGLRLPDL